MLVSRVRRWPNIKTALCSRLVLAVIWTCSACVCGVTGVGGWGWGEGEVTNSLHALSKESRLTQLTTKAEGIPPLSTLWKLCDINSSKIIPL